MVLRLGLKSIIVMGIDQGLANVGYAIVDFRSMEDFDIINSGSFITKPENTLSQRMRIIYDNVNTLMNDYEVEHMGCERFFFNPSDKTLKFRSSTIVRTNMVSGLLFLLADQHRIAIEEYVPGTIKKHVTDNGRASKKMVIQSIIDLYNDQGKEIDLKKDHEADAIAIALKVGDEVIKKKEDQLSNE